MTNIIVFPINLIIMTLFRKSRPRKQRKSRVAQALQEGEDRKQVSESCIAHACKAKLNGPERYFRRLGRGGVKLPVFLLMIFYSVPLAEGVGV